MRHCRPVPRPTAPSPVNSKSTDTWSADPVSIRVVHTGARDHALETDSRPACGRQPRWEGTTVCGHSLELRLRSGAGRLAASGGRFTPSFVREEDEDRKALYGPLDPDAFRAATKG